jgi:hypothetical protein
LDGRHDIAAGEKVRGDGVGGDFDAGFDRGDAGVDDEIVGHATEAHTEQVGKAHGRAVELGLQPSVDESDDDETDDQRGHADQREEE